MRSPANVPVPILRSLAPSVALLLAGAVVWLQLIRGRLASAIELINVARIVRENGGDARVGSGLAEQLDLAYAGLDEMSGLLYALLFGAVLMSVVCLDRRVSYRPAGVVL